MPSKNGEPATSFKEATSADITGATETPPQAKNKMGLFISMEDLARSSRATTISFRSKLNNAGHPPSFRQQSARHGTLTEVPYRNRRLVAAAKESKGEALIDKGSLDMTPSSRSAHSETETEAWRPWPLRATVKICRRQSSRHTMTGGVSAPNVSTHKASRLKCSPLARARESPGELGNQAVGDLRRLVAEPALRGPLGLRLVGGGNSAHGGLPRAR